jgi:anaerobic ribonucleoside-triphosphate reductase
MLCQTGKSDTLFAYTVSPGKPERQGAGLAAEAVKEGKNMRIIKRSGTEVAFDITKIVAAVEKANKEVVETDRLSLEQIKEIAKKVTLTCSSMNRTFGVEEIQDLVENEIMEMQAFEVARKYITYRYKRALVRKANSTDEQILSLIECNNEEVKQENSNKNPVVNSVQRDYMAGEVSKDITKRFLLPEKIVKAHEAGIIHFHDSDYFAQHMHNCCLVNLEDMLQNGTVISETMIDRPKSFSTACNIATQSIAQIASSQYGGQSITLSHLAPFVDVSRKKYLKMVKEEYDAAGLQIDDSQIASIAELRVREEIKRGVQMIQYQVITLMTTNGQAPFVTVFMYLDEVPEGRTRDDLALVIEEMLTQRILGVKNEKGVYITPAFPKLIYVLEEDNVREGSKYWALTQLAAKCTAKRMVPDYISEKVMKKLKDGNCYPCMGCRSFLTVYHDESNRPKFYGRFNQGVVTLNLVDVACSSKGDMEQFWNILDERLQLCYEALMCRHNRLKGTPSDVAPILWQYGALARLKKGETIDKLLYNGYSTISLGYAGLCECTRYMTGLSHTNPEATPFALEVMQRLNDACAKWKAETNIDFSIYGTPLESTTYKFAKCLQKRFGKIEGVTDKNYITNSYHVHVTEEIDAFKKLTFESKFQELSPGGAVSYVEVPNMQNNIDAVLSVMQHIYDNIMYAELNTKSDYCQQCGFDGEIQISSDKEGKLIWRCPNCGNTDQDTMNVARRTCGYIGTQFWNQGRTQEIKERVLHL